MKKEQLTEEQKRHIDVGLRQGFSPKQVAVRWGLTESLVEKYIKVSRR